MKDKKYVIIKRERQILSLLFHGNCLLHAVAEKDTGNYLDNIYIGKIKNIATNINAAFVEIEPGFACFLALNDARKPILTNRTYDGRLLAGDELVVQVSKEAVKTKQPTVTTDLSVSGKYCVISYGKPGIAYSAKLSMKKKNKIKEVLEKEGLSIPSNMGMVIRTNAKELSDYQPLITEINQLITLLKDVTVLAIHRTCYAVLYKKPAGYLMQLRDMYAGQCDEIVTDVVEIYEDIREYSLKNSDFLLPEIRLYQDDILPLYKLYSIETKLKEAMDKKVWLSSGGYLIIEPTEALTVIDVNTGKVISKKNNEDTFFQMNIEAAEEIARQLILRNISGIIIVDFINMKKEENNNRLMEYFGELLKKDSIRTNLVDLTALGLVEITRMKKNKPLMEQLTGKD